jgi:Fic-DOC domain mobile mystery protein B
VTRAQASRCTHPGCGRRTADPVGACWQHRSADTSLALAAVYGATPVEPDEAAQLVPGVKIGTRAELEALEEQGVAHALIAHVLDALANGGPEWLLDDLQLRTFHEAAFGRVWTWAGKYRARETNIGVAPHEIATQTRALMDDARAWWEYETYALVERAVRLHARIGAIHPFVNGNGRVARLYAELLLAASGNEIRLGWSRRSVTDAVERRRRYIDTLRRADAADDFSELVAFAVAP